MIYRAHPQLLSMQEKEQASGTKVTCGGCWRQVEFSKAYRCFHCKVWFCSTCSEVHFKHTENPLDKTTQLKLISILLVFKEKIKLSETYKKYLILSIRDLTTHDLPELSKTLEDLSQKPRPKWMFTFFGLYDILLPPEENVCNIKAVE